MDIFGESNKDMETFSQGTNNVSVIEMVKAIKDRHQSLIYKRYVMTIKSNEVKGRTLLNSIWDCFWKVYIQQARNGPNAKQMSLMPTKVAMGRTTENDVV